MKQRILNAIFSKEFREQVVKQVAEESLSAEAIIPDNPLNLIRAMTTYPPFAKGGLGGI